MRRKGLLSAALLLVVGLAAVSIHRLIKTVKATAITLSSFTSTSYQLGATNVTHTFTFISPGLDTSDGVDDRIQISLIAVDGTDSASYCDASLDSFTDDGADVSGLSMSPQSAQNGVCSGVTIAGFSSSIGVGSTVVVTITGVTNPSTEGSYLPHINDSYYNQTETSATPLQAFGTPLLKLEVTEPDGATPVAGANVWVHNGYYTKSGNAQTDVAGKAYLFSDQFWVPSGETVDDTYAIHVEVPAGSDYTNANVISGVSISTGSTADYTASGSGPVKLTRPMLKGTVVVPSGCSTCNVGAGTTVSDVNIDVRDTSFNPSNFIHTMVDSNGLFKIGGLSGTADGTTYIIEFHSPWDMSDYKGLIPPSPIEDFTVYDTDGDSVVDYVKYDSDGDGTKEQTNYDSLPIDLGNYPFRVASKTISGRVTDENGSPMANVSVRAFKMMQPEMVDSTTDANGNYSLLVGGGNWMFMPEIDFHTNFDNDSSNDVTAGWVYCGMPKSASFTDDTSTESSTGNNFTVKTASVTITGKVETPDGQPLTGGNGDVSVYSKDGCGSHAVIDAYDGTFSANVPPGTYNITVHTWQEKYAAPPSVTVTVSSGTVDVGTLTLTTKQARISGKLWADANGNNQYDSGEGVGGVRVEAFKAAKKFDEFSGGPAGGPMGGGGDWSSTESSNVTATKGNFELKVTKGTWIVNVMADPGMTGGYSSNSVDYIYTGAPIQVSIGTDTGSSTGNNFELKIADATINGRVVNSETNQGIGGIYGFAFAEPAGTYGQGPMMGMGMGAMINNSVFTIKVPAGSYRIGVDFPPETSGYTPGSTASVTAVAGQEVSVDVPVTPNNAVVRVRFKDVNGNLVTDLAHAEVFMDNGAGGHQWRMFSQEDLTNGYVDIDVAAGEWNVGYHIDPTENNYMSESMTENKVTAVANQTVTKDITLRVVDSTVSGTVYTPDGDPLSGAFISLDSRKASNFSMMGGPMLMLGEMTGADGSYTLNLPAGTYRISAFFPPSATVGGQEVSYLNPEPQEVTISAASPATVDFTFGQSDATITGVITLNGVNQGAFVSAYSNKGGYNETTSTSGSYSLNVTSDATWYLRAIYESGNDVYMSDLVEVAMGGAASKTRNLTLTKAPFTIPDPVSTTFNCAGAKKIVLSNNTEISIPAGAIKPSSVTACNSNDSSSNVTITVSPTAQMSSQDKSIPIGVGYEITAKDSNGAIISDTFSSNVTITIPYTDTEIQEALGGTVDEDLLGNGYWDTATSAWRTVNNQVLDTEANTLTISTNHFTLFGVLAASDPLATSSTSSGVSSGTTSSGSVSKPMAPKDVGSIIEGSFNRVVFMIPAGGVKWDANFDIAKIDSGFNKPRPPLWIASGPYRTTMRSWWNGAQFSDFEKPVTLIVRYDPTALGEIPERSLRLNYYDQEQGVWRPISSLLIRDRHEVAAVINRVEGIYALIGGFGYQGAPLFTNQTVTAEADSDEVGLSEEVLPRKEVKEEVRHPSASAPAPAPEQAAKKSWFRRLWEKIVSIFR